MIVFVLGNQLYVMGNSIQSRILGKKLGETSKYIMLPLSSAALCRNFTLPQNDPQKGKFGPEVLWLDGNLSEKSLSFSTYYKLFQILGFAFLFLEEIHDPR